MFLFKTFILPKSIAGGPSITDPIEGVKDLNLRCLVIIVIERHWRSIRQVRNITGMLYADS
jgi:hypothetical protein